MLVYGGPRRCDKWYLRGIHGHHRSRRTLTATDIAVGSPTTFDTVTSGSNAFTILSSHNIACS